MPGPLGQGQWVAEHSPRWRERRAAAKESAAGTAQLADAEARWEAYVAPEMARLETAMHTARQHLEGLVCCQEREAARWNRLAVRSHSAGRAAGQFADSLTAYREALDVGKSPTLSGGRRPLRPAPWVPPAHHQPPVQRNVRPRPITLDRAPGRSLMHVRFRRSDAWRNHRAQYFTPVPRGPDRPWRERYSQFWRSGEGGSSCSHLTLGHGRRRPRVSARAPPFSLTAAWSGIGVDHVVWSTRPCTATGAGG